MEKRNFIRLFELRKGHLDSRVKRDYVTKGIATIPCRISSYSDVINPYSAQDYETPNTEFLDYLQTTASVTPPECPLVLNIIGGGLSQEEYEEILKVMKSFRHYSVLAHLDLLSRCDQQGIYPFEKVQDIIAEILTLAIRDCKGIELNTSSWHYGLADTQPSRAILRDELGFREFCTFEKMRPVFHRL